MISRSATVARLKEVQAQHAKPLRSADLVAANNQLYAAALHHFGSLQAAREAAGLAKPELPRKWSAKLVLKELKRLDRQGLHMTTFALEKAGHRGVTRAALACFGSFDTARQRAGISAPPRKPSTRLVWDSGVVVAEIAQRHRKGKTLAYSKAPIKLVTAAIRYFGSWEEAITAANLDYDEIRLVRAAYERDEILEILRDLAKHSPAMNFAELYSHGIYNACVREFGSIKDALRNAGLVDWPQREIGPLLSANEVLLQLRQHHRRGQSLARVDVETGDHRLFTSACRHFAMWEKAIHAAGLIYEPLRRTWQPEEIKAKLRERRQAGKPMNPAALREDDAALYQAAKIHLGYTAAYAQRYYGAPKLHTTWTQERVIKEIRQLHRAEEPLPPALKVACSQLFGSIVAARDAANVPQLRTAWDKNRVIEEIRALNGNRPDKNLVGVAQRKFGSWRKALAAAGVAAKKRLPWTRDDIRQALQARIAAGLDMNVTTLMADNQSLYDGIRNNVGNVPEVLAHFVRTGHLLRPD